MAATPTLKAICSGLRDQVSSIQAVSDQAKIPIHRVTTGDVIP